MERILLTQLGFLGDVILSTPVIAELKANFPEATISVLTTQVAKPLVEFHPAVSEVIAYDKYGTDSGFTGFARISAQLRKREFTSLFSLHRSLRTTLLHATLGVALRYGFREAKASWLYHKTTDRLNLKHDVLRNLALLRVIGIDPLMVNPKLEIGVPTDIVESVAVHLPGRYITVCPGSVWPTKRWTVQGFAALCKRLVERGERVVLIGGPADRVLAEEIERLSASSLNNLVGKLSLIESVAALSRAVAVITNDSAPLHMASAFKRPVVAIFCSTVPEFGFGPWETRSEIVSVGHLSCRPCSRHGKSYCPAASHACQIGISVQTVLDSLDRVLKE